MAKGRAKICPVCKKGFFVETKFEYGRPSKFCSKVCKVQYTSNRKKHWLRRKREELGLQKCILCEIWNNREELDRLCLAHREYIESAINPNKGIL